MVALSAPGGREPGAGVVRCVVIDPGKLTDDALEPDNPLGRHTARVFTRATALRGMEIGWLSRP